MELTISMYDLEPAPVYHGFEEKVLTISMYTWILNLLQFVMVLKRG